MFYVFFLSTGRTLKSARVLPLFFVGLRIKCITILDVCKVMHQGFKKDFWWEKFQPTRKERKLGI